MSPQTFDNAFDALMDTPEEAANMTLRSDLMRAIRKEVQSWAEPQTTAAKRSASASRASTTCCATASTNSASTPWSPWPAAPA